jgi:hypothetical protein
MPTNLAKKFENMPEILKICSNFPKISLFQKFLIFQIVLKVFKFWKCAQKMKIFQNKFKTRKILKILAKFLKMCPNNFVIDQ